MWGMLAVSPKLDTEHHKCPFLMKATFGMENPTMKGHLINKERIMNRRSAIRNASLLAFGMALGKLDALKANGGQLTVDLGQWEHVVFTLHKKTISVPVAEVFRALQEGV
jgi:hypothetical protein